MDQFLPDKRGVIGMWPRILPVDSQRCELAWDGGSQILTNCEGTRDVSVFLRVYMESLLSKLSFPSPNLDSI